MPTRTSRSKNSSIEPEQFGFPPLASSGAIPEGERSEPGGIAELVASGGAAAAGPRAGRYRVSDERVDEALAGARLRRALGELDEDGREALVDELLAGLADQRDPLPDELRERLLDGMLGELLAGRRGEREILGSGGLLGELTRRLIERALREELTEHLGYPAGHAPPGGAGNARNGGTPKTLLTEHGPVRIETPRDREGEFEPQLVKKNQRRVEGLDEKIVALYAGGMTTREIETYFADLYGPGVSRETVSRVTAAVLEDAKAWQRRPLEQLYPILYLDALVIKIRDGQAVRNHACYLAIGVNLDGERDVLGIWFQRTEGAKFWLQVLTELKTRGVQDVLVCCVDGLEGFPDAIEAVFPKTWVQTCVVHLIRSSLRFVPEKDRRQVAKDLKPIYTAANRDHAWEQLEQFAEKWDPKYPMISQSWTEKWERIVPFLAFPPDVRRVVYTTNTIEALNRQIRKIIKTRGSFPDEDSARKLLYLAITRAQRKWRHAYNWSSALTAFRIHFADRIPDTAI
jgi:putative transposase